eukprot:scaffold73363_cov60-Phaeocystis_antarctica.AAC.10
MLAMRSAVLRLKTAETPVQGEARTLRGSRPEWHTALVALKCQQDPQRDLVKVSAIPNQQDAQHDQREGTEEAEEEGDVGADPRESVLVPDQLHGAARRLVRVRVRVSWRRLRLRLGLGMLVTMPLLRTWCGLSARPLIATLE